jgi:crotonobetainyl-CoA:carnitine CoA-transferase CaiB-like acyl-CoA transferase
MRGAASDAPRTETSEMTTAPADGSAETAPLAGVRVLDLGQGIAGPYATKWMGGLGAEVIKIEPPSGDPSRQAGPYRNDEPDPEASGLYLYLNTSKRGVTLDLDTEEGREVLRELAATADIVVESFAPGYLDERGLGYDALREAKPELVLVSVTPFGQDGPYAGMPAEELTLYALSGHMWLTGDEHRPPLKNGGSQPSYQAGLNALTAALIAYFGALMHGEGTHVDLSALETLGGMMELYGPFASQAGISPRRRGNTVSAIYGTYACADGYAGVYCLPRNYENMAKAVGMPELLEPPFADADERLRSNDMLEALLTGWFYQHTGKEVFELGKEHRFPAGYVATVEDLAESEQLRERHFFAEDDHPRAGHLRFPAHLWLSDGHGWESARAPELGQHTDEVLAELGYDDERRAQLRAAGALGAAVHA